MKRILLKLLFVVLLVSGSTLYSQTALPGTIEVENGDISNNSSHATRNKVGSGNGGTNNIIQQFRRDGGKDGTIINHVSIAADGNYDFEFTYFKNKPVVSNVTINSTNSSGGSVVQLASLTIADNSATATSSSYGTIKVLNVPLTTSIQYITIVTTSTLNSDIDLDNIIVTSSAAAPVITLTGSSTVNVIAGDGYTDAGATAVASDGTTDISGSIVVGGDTVDVNTPGTYTITYNLTDGGVAAVEVTRTVVVYPSTTRIASQAGNWNLPATWGGKSVPGTSAEVLIISDLSITVSDAQEVSSIKNNGTITINSGGSLTVSGDVYLSKFDNGIQVQSGTETSAEAMGTLIVGGIVGTLNQDLSTDTSDKRLAARKVLDNDKWYLLSSISSKQPRVNRMTGGSDFRTNGVPAYSIAVYNNANAANSKYQYFSTTLTDSDEITLGAGMSVSVNGSGNSNTTGMFEYDAFFSHGASITTAIATDGVTSDSFNLLGNPYLSNLHGNDNADATNNLLKVNNDAGVLAEQTLWFWNPDSSSWVTKNQSSAAFTVPPLTGFFVKSSVAGGNFTYTTAMETHTASGSLLSKNASQRFAIDLNVSNGKTSRSTNITYIDNKTTGFDNGYDSSTFGGYASEFEVYTELVEENSSKKLAIQSLPTNYEELVVPVGIKVSEEKEYTISADALNLPEGIKVYLEDRLLGTFTRLDESGADYKVILSGETKGRFFLHTKSSSALSADSELLNSVKIYKNGINSLRITGLSTGKASVKIYNVLGTQVFSKSFSSRNVNDIELPKVNTSVYIVQLDTEKGSLNKKIVLE